MAIQLGGVSFQINVTGGKSAQNARSIADALARVNREMEKTIRLSKDFDLDIPDAPKSSGSRRSSESRRPSSGGGSRSATASAGVVSRALVPAIKSLQADIKTLSRSITVVGRPGGIVRRRSDAEAFADAVVSHLRRGQQPAIEGPPQRRLLGGPAAASALVTAGSARALVPALTGVQSALTALNQTEQRLTRTMEGAIARSVSAAGRAAALPPPGRSRVESYTVSDRGAGGSGGGRGGGPPLLFGGPGGGDVPENNKVIAGSFHEIAASIVAVATALGAARFTNFIKESTLLAGRVQNLDTVMRNTAHTANFAGGEVSLYEQDIKALGITTQVTRTIMTRFAQNNLELADAANIARIAQDAAVVAGINSSQATERMAVAIQRLDTRMLRNLGLLVNLRQEYQAYGLATGRVETSLTAAEKQQIVLNAVLREGAALAGNYEAAMEDVFKRYTSLDRKVEEASRTFGENFLPIFEKVVDLFDFFLDMEVSPAFQVIGSSAASTAVTFTALGATVTLGKVLWTSYSRAVLSAAAAEGVAATATTGLSGAMATLNAVIAANPFLAAAVAVGALAAGVITLSSSIAAQSQLMQERALRDAEAQVATEHRVRRIAQRIEELGTIENRTTNEQSLLNAAMREAIEIEPLLSGMYAEATQSADGYMKILEGLRRTHEEAFVFSAEDQLQNLRNAQQVIEGRLEQLRAQQKAIDNANLRSPVAGMRFELPDAWEAWINPETNAGQQQRLQNQFEINARRIRANVELLNAERLRLLDNLDEQADTAQQLALRLKSQLEDAFLSDADDATQALVRLEVYRESLSTSIEPMEKIMERLNATIQKAQLDLDRKTEAAKEQFSEGSDELLQAITKAENAFGDAVTNTRLTAEANVERRKDTLAVFDDLRELSERELQSTIDSLSELRREMDLLDRGVSRNLVNGLSKVEEIQQKGAISTDIQADKIEGLRTRIQELQRALLSATEEQAEAIQLQLSSANAALINAEAIRALTVRMTELRTEQELSQIGPTAEELRNMTADAAEAERALDGLKDALRLDAAGASDDLISVVSGLQSVREEGVTALTDLLEQQRKIEADIQVAQDKGFTGVVGRLTQQLNTLQDTIGQAYDRVQVQQAQLAQDFIQSVQQQVRDFQDGIEQASLSVETFIARESGNQPLAQALQRVSQFRGAAAQVTNFGQLEEIVRLLKANGLGAFQDTVIQAGANRLKQIQDQKRQLEANIQAANYLSQMVDTSLKQLSLQEETNAILRQIVGDSRPGSMSRSAGGTGRAGGSGGPIIYERGPDGTLQRRGGEDRANMVGGFRMLPPRYFQNGRPLDQNPGGSPFPQNFNAGGFVAPASRLGQSVSNLSDRLETGLNRVAGIFDASSDRVNQLSETVDAVVERMNNKEQATRRAKRGAGL